jgi:hypothetical protein
MVIVSMLELMIGVWVELPHVLRRVAEYRKGIEAHVALLKRDDEQVLLNGRSSG